MMKRSSFTTRQQHWVSHLQACAERGLTLSVYAAREGLVGRRIETSQDTPSWAGIMAGRGAPFRTGANGAGTGDPRKSS